MTRVELATAGPPRESRCRHCGCRLVDYGDGWEYEEPTATEWVDGPTCTPGRERECPDYSGDHTP